MRSMVEGAAEVGDWRFSWSAYLSSPAQPLIRPFGPPSPREAGRRDYLSAFSMSAAIASGLTEGA